MSEQNFQFNAKMASKSSPKGAQRTPWAAQRGPEGAQRTPKIDFLVHLSAEGAHRAPPESHMVSFGEDLGCSGGGFRCDWWKNVR
jgi:hypothetical protein